MKYGQWIENSDGVLVRRKVRTSPWKTEGGFRIIRAFTIDHNAQRFRRYVDQLGRKLHRDRAHKKFYLSLRRRKRADAARQ